MKIFLLALAVSVRVVEDTRIAHSLLCGWCNKKVSGCSAPKVGPGCLTAHRGHAMAREGMHNLESSQYLESVREDVDLPGDG